jgi:hypothetical protein
VQLDPKSFKNVNKRIIEIKIKRSESFKSEAIKYYRYVTRNTKLTGSNTDRFNCFDSVKQGVIVNLTGPMCLSQEGS